MQTKFEIIFNYPLILSGNYFMVYKMPQVTVSDRNCAGGEEFRCRKVPLKRFKCTSLQKRGERWRTSKEKLIREILFKETSGKAPETLYCRKCCHSHTGLATLEI